MLSKIYSDADSVVYHIRTERISQIRNIETSSTDTIDKKCFDTKREGLILLHLLWTGNQIVTSKYVHEKFTLIELINPYCSIKFPDNILFLTNKRTFY